MDNGTKETFPRWMIVVLTAATLAILAGGVWFYRFQERQQQWQVEEQLSAIAQLKVDEIARWRKDQLDNAEAFRAHPFLGQNAARFLADPNDNNKNDLLTRFRSLANQHDYADILLVDPSGQARLSLSGHFEACEGSASAMAAALREHKTAFVDFHVGKDSPSPHVSVIAPFFTANDQAFGAIILILDARGFLYPLIQSWPTPSRTAETLLVRRDGDHVLFLNDLHHRQDAALKLRIPLTRTDVPAVMAAMGRKGFVTGKDYRGIEVVSFILPVPDSPWFMVSKVDADEAFAEMRFRSILLLSMFAVLMGVVFVSGLAAWQREKKKHFRNLFHNEAALHASMERYGITLKAIGDAVIATDAQGRVEILNPLAEALTGWSDAEAHGLPLENVFPIVNEETREKVESPVIKVLREGTVVGLANHTLLIHRDGSARPIADSGAPIRDESGGILGVVLVFRDQTEERATRKALEENENKFKYVFDHSVVPKSITLLSGEVNTNDAFQEMLGYSRVEMEKLKWQAITHPEDIPESEAVIASMLSEAKPSGRFVKRYLRKDGGVVWGDVSTSLRRDENGNPMYFMTTVVDITGRKRAEEAHQDSEKRYRRLFEAAKDGILIIDAGTEKVIDVNPFLLRLLGYSLDELLGKHLWEIGPFKDIAASKEAFKVLKDKEYVRYEDLPLETGDGRIVQVEFVSNVYLVDHIKIIQCNIRDITERKQAENALRENELYTRTILNNLPVGIAVNSIDPDVTFSYMNDNFPRYYRTTREALAGPDAFWETVYEDPEFREEMKKKVLEDCASGDPGRMHWVDVPIVRKGEETTFIEAMNVQVPGEELMVSVVWDVTGHKCAEEAIIQAKSDWESTFNAVTDMITVHDLDFNIVQANSSAMTMLGQRVQEGLLGAKCFRCYHGTETPPPECRSCQSLQTQLPCSVEMFEPYLDKHLEIRTMPRFGDDNRMIGLMHIVRDITDRKRTEAERDRLITAIEQVEDEIIIADPEGTILYVNPAFERITGYPRGEAIGQNPRFLKSGEQDLAFYQDLWSTITSGVTWKGRMVNKRKDGKFYTEDAVISPVRDEGGRIVNYVAVKRDITENLKLMSQLQQAQKMESVGRLAGGVAHDFNNMLGVIIGNAEMAMERTAPDDPIRADIQEILDAAQRSTEITRQLLAFARKQIVVPKVIDLNEAVEGSLKMLRRLIGEDIYFSWMPGAKPWPVKTDPSQIDQILINLCVNARDAIKGVGRITIETDKIVFDEFYCIDHEGFVPGEFVMLAVSDDGAGMDKATLDHMFEPFFTTKQIGRGTGLGLATVYGIVKQNGGLINVYSEPGKGSVFRIYLPRHVGQAEEKAAESAQAIQMSRGETVLVAEDEPAILKLAGKYLQKLGYAVLSANSPSEAIEMAQAHAGAIHLLLTDVVMPEMNGKDLAEAMRVLRPEIKCLFMSGYTADAIAHHGLLDAGIHFISKPFSMPDLARKIREALLE